MVGKDTHHHTLQKCDALRQKLHQEASGGNKN